MEMAAMAVALLRIMEALPRRAPQNWLADFNRGEFFLLNYLYINNGSAWPSNMSKAMQTSSARITAALNGLERKGLVKRESDNDDHRRKLVHLTSEGFEYIEGYRDRALHNITKLLSELGEKDASEYLRITQRMETISRNFEFDL